MVFNQISQPRQRVSLRIAFSELDALSGSKTSGCTTSPHLRFSNHGRSGGSQTTPPMARALGPVQRPWQIGRFSNPGGLRVIPIGSSATVADQVVLKRARKVCVLFPFSNHGRLGGSQTNASAVSPSIRFGNHGRSGGSQTHIGALEQLELFSNHGRSGGSQTCGCGYAV